MCHPVIPLLVALVYPLTLLPFASMVIVVLALLGRREMVVNTMPFLPLASTVVAVFLLLTTDVATVDVHVKRVRRIVMYPLAMLPFASTFVRGISTLLAADVVTKDVNIKT
uniref:ABC transporter permease n=1 Tax=Panagrellus redivivus TaxID=6233 RepID=A0A7E4ZR60_PANRE